MIRTLTTLMLAGLMGGCTLGPDPVRPRSVADSADQFANAPIESQVDADFTRWWESFDDPTTNQLVEQALAANTDLRAAAARVMQSQALLGAAIGRRFPAVGASIGRTRSRNTFDFGGGRMSNTNSTYTMQVDVSWQVDLFGKLRRSQEQSWLNLLSVEAQQEAVLHTVIASVVRTRAQLATLQRQLAIAKANTASFESTYNVIKRRYERGVANALELRLAGENLAASKAREPEIELNLRTTQHALDVLMGRQPGKTKPVEDSLAELPAVQGPATGVPLSLLDRRPDLRVAEFRAAAEQAGIGVAIADLFPDITISAAVGYQASNFDDMFDPQALIWSLVSQAAVKVWQGGALRANVDATRAAAEAAAADYATNVLTAMREVEDALVTEKMLRRVHGHLTTRVEEAREAERLAQQRYERGVETLLTVLETERRRRLAEEDRVLTQRALWETRVNLYLALGGDWGVAPPTVADPQFIEKQPDPRTDRQDAKLPGPVQEK